MLSKISRREGPQKRKEQRINEKESLWERISKREKQRIKAKEMLGTVWIWNQQSKDKKTMKKGSMAGKVNSEIYDVLWGSEELFIISF